MKQGEPESIEDAIKLFAGISMATQSLLVDLIDCLDRSGAMPREALIQRLRERISAVEAGPRDWGHEMILPVFYNYMNTLVQQAAKDASKPHLKPISPRDSEDSDQ
jgi:hypothetical protein